MSKENRSEQNPLSWFVLFILFVLVVGLYASNSNLKSEIVDLEEENSELKSLVKYIELKVFCPEYQSLYDVIFSINFTDYLEYQDALTYLDEINCEVIEQ